MRKFMQCPSAQQSEVMYNDLSTENLYKGNYAACCGGGAFIDATPHPQANRNLAGVFGVVTNVRKYPIGERIGAGKGTKIGNMPDGSSNTLLLSEVLAWHQPDGRTDATHPSGMNRDVRGAMLIPM